MDNCCEPCVQTSFSASKSDMKESNEDEDCKIVYNKAEAPVDSPEMFREVTSKLAKEGLEIIKEVTRPPPSRLKLHATSEETEKSEYVETVSSDKGPSESESSKTIDIERGPSPKAKNPKQIKRASQSSNKQVFVPEMKVTEDVVKPVTVNETEPVVPEQNNFVNRREISFKCIMVPAQVVGLLIGRKGAEIEKIRRDSGAAVSIPNSKTGGGHKFCFITGTRAQVEAAQFFVNSVITSVMGPENLRKELEHRLASDRITASAEIHEVQPPSKQPKLDADAGLSNPNQNSSKKKKNPAAKKKKNLATKKFAKPGGGVKGKQKKGPENLRKELEHRLASNRITASAEIREVQSPSKQPNLDVDAGLSNPNQSSSKKKKNPAAKKLAKPGGGVKGKQKKRPENLRKELEHCLASDCITASAEIHEVQPPSKQQKLDADAGLSNPNQSSSKKKKNPAAKKLAKPGGGVKGKQKKIPKSLKRALKLLAPLSLAEMYEEQPPSKRPKLDLDADPGNLNPSSSKKKNPAAKKPAGSAKVKCKKTEEEKTFCPKQYWERRQKKTQKWKDSQVEMRDQALQCSGEFSLSADALGKKKEPVEETSLSAESDDSCCIFAIFIVSELKKIKNKSDYNMAKSKINKILSLATTGKLSKYCNGF